jgi:hypothetical protein
MVTDTTSVAVRRTGRQGVSGMTVIIIVLCAWVAAAIVVALLLGSFIRLGTSDVRPRGLLEPELAEPVSERPPASPAKEAARAA